MSKGRFLNQKLGKRMSRKSALLKSQLGSQRVTPQPGPARLPKKGVSREGPRPSTPS
jgi:hypothetical protein